YIPILTHDIYTLSLHDALPISTRDQGAQYIGVARDHRESLRHCSLEGNLALRRCLLGERTQQSNQRNHSEGDPTHMRHCHFHSSDRKSTRLNSSHVAISYAVFC